ncbi:uncharacterized protein LOC117487461 [Trematomus bernacchii]|uniref:uncharacterized protein LOC117487461 n=1 Tax=Trematomus bernacchii TaxID=40690 RepID=UPI00146C6537|nr:uncharacterized protein LOC117487461 [Trematomus bernacchii]
MLQAGLLELDVEEASRGSNPVSQHFMYQRTAAYVKDQTSRIGGSPSKISDIVAPIGPHLNEPSQHSKGEDVKPTQSYSLKGLAQTQAAVSTQTTPHHTLKAPRPGTPAPPWTLNKQSPFSAYQPNQGTPYEASYHNPQTTNDLAKYLARSNLVTSGLTTFDDQPMNYWAWKTSFLSAIAGLDLSVGEELDLLCKYLGKESSDQVRRIKAVNIRHPDAGLMMAWERLEEIYGSPEVIEQALFDKLESFTILTNKDPKRLRELADLLLELEAAKRDGSLPGLSYLDTSRGVKPIIEKLPYNIQEKWISYGSRYKRDHHVSFPPFSVFADFVRTEAKARNDPSFNLSTTVPMEKKSTWEKFTKMPVSVHKTQVSSADRYESREDKKLTDPNNHCPLHKKPHPLKKCRSFREKSLEERKQLLKEHSFCFRCCSSTGHLARNCTAEVRCIECGSTGHVSALHPGPAVWKPKPSPPSSEHGGEEDKEDHQVTSRCTQVCGEGVSARACSKICLVSVYPAGRSEEAKKMYAILDEQSNHSLARSEFFNVFKITGPSFPYTLKTCAGLTQTTGRRASGFTVESADKKLSFPLPTLLECNQVPNNRSEVPTPNAAHHHAHLKCIADEIPPLDPNADILFLLGRDILRVHKVREQISGPDNAPFAQRLDLGWVVVGDVCLAGAHKPLEVNSYKTSILENGRTSHLQPCNNQIKIREIFNQAPDYTHHPALTSKFSTATHDADSLGQTIFTRTANDHKLAPSVEDMKFLKIMEAEFHQDSSKSWVGPLPFRLPRQRLPNNRKQAQDRLASLRRTLEKRPQMKAHFLEFTAKQIRSDCGTNFVGASRELQMKTTDPSGNNVEKYLSTQNCTWVFNPPHASHMGGAWERMIGIARRILDYLLLEQKKSSLTHEVLLTLMAEVTAVINARPLIPVSSDPESPLILTPAMLLTLKTGSTPPPPGNFEEADLFKEQWKQVQSLADTFWSRWRKEYLKTRHKWRSKRSNLQEGDIVLLKDNQAQRNEWPMATITKTFPGRDGLVRKIEVEISKDKTKRIFSRPVTEVVLLLSPKTDSC